MKLSALSETDDHGRSKRMAVGYVVALGVFAGIFVCAAAFGGQVVKQQIEESVEVKLVKQAEPAKPPPPPPPPKPAMRVASRNPAPQLGNAEGPPKEVPKDLPKEGDANKPLDAVEHHDGYGDPNGVKGGKGRGGVAEVAPAPVETAAPAPMTQEAVAVVPPSVLTKVAPAYPEEARKQSLETIVEVFFYVTTEGLVEDIRIVRGNPLFEESVRTALAAWRFTPGTIDGVKSRMRRRIKIPFRLRTQ